MPVLWPPSAPLIASAEVVQKLRDSAIYYDLFDETLAAGSVDGTDSTDENALREVYDTGNLLELVDKLILDGVTADHDPALWHTTLVPGPWTTRNAYAHYWQIDLAAGVEFEFGLDANTTIDLSPVHLEVTSTPGYEHISVNGDLVATFADDTTVHILVMRRYDSAGYLYLYRVDDDNWRLFWMDERTLISA